MQKQTAYPKTKPNSVDVLVIPYQTISLKDLVQSVKGKIKKIYFQCELESGTHGIQGRIIAYAAHKNVTGKWVLGKKVSAAIDNSKPISTLSLPISLANCEWTRTGAIKRHGEKSKDFTNRKIQASAIRKLNRIPQSSLKKGELTFGIKKSSNPHLEYTVTLDAGDGSTYTSDAKPSPPAPPSY